MYHDDAFYLYLQKQKIAYRRLASGSSLSLLSFASPLSFLSLSLTPLFSLSICVFPSQFIIATFAEVERAI